MNTEKIRIEHRSNTNTWGTPWVFFNKYKERHGITFDVCASKENTKCKNFFSEEDDALSQEWNGVCWMNPPYGRGITGKWVEKAFNEAHKINCKVIALLPSRTDTKWFHEFIYKKVPMDNIEFIKGRIKFEGAEHGAPFPSMIVIFNF